MEEGTLATIVEGLLNKDQEIFKNYFTEGSCIANVDPQVKERAEEIYKEYNPNPSLNLEELVEQWKKYKTNKRSFNEDDFPQSTICSSLAYNPSNRKHVMVFSPQKKKTQPKEFDVFEFLKAKKESENYFPIRFQSDFDLEVDVEDLLEEQKTSVVDASLRKIARALTVLNQSCSYRLMDIYSEKVVR